MSPSALDTLEKSVQKAVARIQQLERENDRLRDRAEKLEKSLEEIPTDRETPDWESERNEIRGRVEALVEHLEDVLEE